MRIPAVQESSENEGADVGQMSRSTSASGEYFPSLVSYKEAIVVQRAVEKPRRANYGLRGGVMGRFGIPGLGGSAREEEGTGMGMGMRVDARKWVEGLLRVNR